MSSRLKTAAVALGVTCAVVGTGVAVGAADNDKKSSDLTSAINNKKPKNVILLIGDGMGDAEVTLGRYYGKGAAGRVNMDNLLFRGSSIHYVLNGGPGPNYAPNYAGDSAPTATAWSSGKRTIDGRVGQGPSQAPSGPSDTAAEIGSNDGFKTYMESAREQGKATGNVSTAEITDATPAGPSSHISQRACQGPADTRTTCPLEAKTAATPGLGSIAEQQVDNQFDVVLGGGKSRYSQDLDGVAGGSNVLDYASSKGYTQQPANATDLNGITDLSDGKVLGLFTAGNMTTEFKPLYARTAAWRAAHPGADPSLQGGSSTTRCDETNRPSNEPSLSEMTTKAIELLDGDKDGFTLQVEGASIDKRDHAADVCGQIGEQLEFDKAVGAAQEFQASHPDTLIIVTADHAHTSQIINANSTPATGTSYATVQTADGAPIRIAYGTANTGDGGSNTDPTAGSQAHTGAQVPVWASGPSAWKIQGTIDQTDIFAVVSGKAGTQK